MYLHWVNFPLFVDWYKGGERFGFRAGTVRTVKIPTSDGKLLGAWHITPRSKEVPDPHSKPTLELQEQNLDDADIVFLYCHGNAGNRATYHRTSFYKACICDSNSSRC